MNGSTWPARSLLRYISPITIVIIVIVLILLYHHYRPNFAAFMLIIPILLHQVHHCQQCIHFVNFFAYLLDSKSAEGFHKTGFCTFNQWFCGDDKMMMMTTMVMTRMKGGFGFNQWCGGQHIKWQPWDGQSICSPSDLLKISLSTSSLSSSTLTSTSSSSSSSTSSYDMSLVQHQFYDDRPPRSRIAPFCFSIFYNVHFFAHLHFYILMCLVLVFCLLEF